MLGTKLSIEQIKLIHKEITAGNWVVAANMVQYGFGEEPSITTPSEATQLLRGLLNAMIDCGNYLGAIALCLPETVFNTGPESIRRQADAFYTKPLLLSMGGSSLSKTYTLVVLVYLDWLRDPEYTSVRLLSQTDTHLQTNVWAHLLETHERNVLKPEKAVDIKPTELWMGIKDTPRSYGFQGHAFKQSQITSSVFFGLKPQPKRREDHPDYLTFGPMTRLRVLIDEAGHSPAGVWKGLNSVIASISGDRVKVAAAFNPEDISMQAVQMAEPVGGWHTDQMETLYDYESKYGWWVVRIDGAKTENVVQRKEVYPGLMTYERYLGYLKGGGDNSPSYSVFARGFPPLQQSNNTIIPPDWASTQRGEALYVGKVDNLAAVDLAYQGADRAIIGIGRWGLAHGWRDQNGKRVDFVNRLNPKQKQPRHVLTIDQFFVIPKSLDAVGVTQEIMGKCKQLKVPPEWVAMDSTGGGMATYSYASVYWGKILGINWAEKATDMKVLSDDLAPAIERFDGVPSEMWFAFRDWMDPNVCAVLLHPAIQSADLYSQMTSRRYKRTRNGRLHIESKDEYKARNAGKSPDEMDVVVMMLHLCRVRGGVTPGIIEQKNRNAPQEGGKYNPVTPTAETIDRSDPLSSGEEGPLEGGQEVHGDLDLG